MSSLVKPWALVTGASSGIGAEFARILAEMGYPVILVARRKDKLLALARSLEETQHVQTRVIVADLSESSAPAALWRELEQNKLEVGILVNNAGFGDHGPFAASDWERTHQMLQLNMVALTALTRFALPGMLARKRGHILNVASTAAFQPGPGMATYFATKSFVLSFTEALWSELRGTGVVATTLCPGPTSSEFFDAAGMSGKKLAARGLPSSREVAAFGIKLAFAGQRTGIHGFANRLLAATTRFLPRGLVLSATRKMLE